MKIQKSKITSYPIGSVCLRCGSDRNSILNCSTWGKVYKRHMWNKEILKIPTFEFTHNEKA